MADPVFSTAASTADSRTIRFLETAAEKYSRLDFQDPSALFNKPAPEPRVTFAIGGTLSAIGFIMWLYRVKIFKRKLRERKIALDRTLLLRAYITSAMDLDDPLYAVIRYAASAFLFLGGIQLEFHWTLFAMFMAYILWATADVTRILLAFFWTPSLKDLIVEEDRLASQMRGLTTQLSPSSVYEDIGRGYTIVIMVFVTQAILIAVVCLDIYSNDLNKCLDGTNDCPVAGTLGSWSFYVMGVLMACVFQLGPKTKYGESEQNPAYWLHLLLTAKENGAKVNWYDPVKDQVQERPLTTGDWRIWARFFMSFLINGIGYHILVQALPVQVAQQTSLTGFVLRAVGMMYLVDMDDTPGYKLTVVLPPSSPPNVIGGSKSEDAKDAPESIDHHHRKDEPPEEKKTNHYMHGASSYDIYKSSQEIVQEAKRKLDALTSAGPSHPLEAIPLDFHTSVRESLFGSFVVRNPKLATTISNNSNNMGRARITTLSPTNTSKEAFYHGTLHGTRTDSFADIDLELGHGSQPHDMMRPQRLVGQPPATAAAGAAGAGAGQQPATIPHANDDGDGE